ncbi:glycosyltransferase family 2 protein [Paenibacillus sp. YIM B09110]|uniref:glycosyltransferase family 2 protein n=1 Tax=Paenibacillus sp. YIM B09110 TaxID=3126102 RepID=UPI00301BE8E7
MDGPLISLCMIVKDEAHTIRRCLESVRGVADELIVVDTGSNDGTDEICRSYGAKVIAYAWDNSFARARNAAIAEASGDWILWLDADEELDGMDKGLFRGIAASAHSDVLCLRVVNYYGEKSEQPQAEQAYLLAQARMFRNDGTFYFERDIHETLQRKGADDERLQPAMIPVTVHHYGYMDDLVSQKEKYQRNISLLNEEKATAGHDPWCEYHLAGEYYRNNELEKAFELVNESIVGFLTINKLPPSLAYKLKYEILFRHGSMRGAWPGIERVIKLYPNYVDLHFYKGVFLMEHGLYVEAIAAFERCLELGENHLEYLSLKGTGSHFAASNIARCLSHMGRTIEARAYERYAAALIADSYKQGSREPESGDFLDDDNRIRA